MALIPAKHGDWKEHPSRGYETESRNPSSGVSDKAVNFHVLYHEDSQIPTNLTISALTS